MGGAASPETSRQRARLGCASPRLRSLWRSSASARQELSPPPPTLCLKAACAAEAVVADPEADPGEAAAREAPETAAAEAGDLTEAAATAADPAEAAIATPSRGAERETS